MGEWGYPFAAIVGQEKAKQAILLNLVNPRIGGVLLSGEKGTAKSTIARGAAALSGKKVIDLPLNATEDMVTGALDLETAVKEGVRRFSGGVLARADGNLLYVDEINLLPDSLAAILVTAASLGENLVEREGISHRHACSFVLVGTMNPEEGKLRPQLLDKFGLFVEVRGESDVEQRMEIVRRRLAYEKNPRGFCEAYEPETQKLRKRLRKAMELFPQVREEENIRRVAGQMAASASCQGNRAEILLVETARALAALDGRRNVTVGDLKGAAELVLPHRRVQKADSLAAGVCGDWQMGPRNRGNGSGNQEKGSRSQGDGSRNQRDGSRNQGDGSRDLGDDSGEMGTDGTDDKGGVDSGDAEQPEGNSGNVGNPGSPENIGSSKVPGEDGSDREDGGKGAQGAGAQEATGKDLPGDVGEDGANDDDLVAGEVVYPILCFPNGRKDRLARKGTGRRQKTDSSVNKGRYAKAVMDSGNKSLDLALDATLRAAAPFQRQRRSGNGQIGNGQSGDDCIGNSQSRNGQSGDDSIESSQSGNSQSGDDSIGNSQSRNSQGGDDCSGDNQSGNSQIGNGQSECAIIIEDRDLRYKRRENHVGATIVFVVDASGSMGAARRMKEAKETVLSMLMDSYQKRDKIGMIAFCRKSAETLLSITSSVDLAQKELQSLPTGGKTPLADGLYQAWLLLRARRRKDPQMLPRLVLVTDGRANQALWSDDPVEDALKAAKLIASEKIPAMVVDTENGYFTFHLAEKIAAAMDADYIKVDELRSTQLTKIAAPGRVWE